MGSSLKLQLERNNAERLLYASDTCGAWDYTSLEQVIVNILVDVLWVFQSADTKRVLKEVCTRNQEKEQIVSSVPLNRMQSISQPQQSLFLFNTTIDESR